MQAELDQIDTAIRIHILGVNDIGLESGNTRMMTGRVLPWLQPETGQDIWTEWGVEYRDVIILGPGNEHVGTYNLTVHDLADPENYAELMALLVETGAGD